jgi:hypothetical protein
MAESAVFRAFVFLAFLFSGVSHAGVIDAVAAFVDDAAITVRELDAAHEAAVRITPDMTRQEVLDTLINRTLLMREARKLRLDVPEEELLDAYLELKVKAFIKVSEPEIREFYDANIAEFGGKEYADVKDRIEAYLQEKELNNRLKSHIEDLRSKAYIKIIR